MKKQLHEMSLEELWRLFPIILKEYNSEYKNWFDTEKENLLRLAGKAAQRISHIGSTAVPGLISKPTIDILMEIKNDYNIKQLTQTLTANGWTLMNEQTMPELKWSFNKGYTPDGFADKVFHLHIKHYGDQSELYFRDYLLAHPDIAEEYGNLKLLLQKEFEFNRDGYTEAKTKFIEKHTALAKNEFADTYKSQLS